jgi:DNA-binding NtrC family response regulator
MRRIKNIVVVEDDVWLLDILKIVLSRQGFEVRAVSNGHEAIQMLEEKPAELVITDIFMEEMNGMDVVRIVKKQFPKTKIIAMSGGSPVVMMDSLSVAKKLGADRVLQKPADIPSLLNVVEELDAEISN